jgi:hypothetical protein
MSILTPFNGKLGSTTSVAATATAASVAVDPNSKQYMVTNVGSQLVFVRPLFAGDAAVATSADIPVLPNSQTTLTKQGASQQGHSSISVVAPGGGGSTVYVTSGEGW